MRFLAALVVLVGASVALAQMGGPAPVVVAPVERRALELTRPLVATVEPVTTTKLAAEEGGLILSRSFDEGQRVEQGATLVKMDTALLEARKAAAEAAVRAAEAAINQSRAEWTNAQAELERLKGLRQTQIATEKEVRDAQMAVDVNVARLAAREAEVAAQKAQVDVLALQIAKSQTRSPFAGVVSKRHVEVGQWVQQGDPVADLVQLDPLFVRVNVPESVIAQLKGGDEARVTVDAMGHAEFSATVEQILPEADPATRTFTVKLLLPNPDFKVRPGFFARAVMVGPTADDMLAVPKDAVVTQGKQSHVVVVRENKAAIVPVERGASDTRYTLVKGALKLEDKVVTRGNETLMPGQDVVVQQ
jgi:membrane fusion protein (multidrug efflux system)